ncbi:hypothetical protein K2X30_10575 [bacterium]|nr:hypothetical protein [bacterium]
MKYLLLVLVAVSANSAFSADLVCNSRKANFGPKVYITAKAKDDYKEGKEEINTLRDFAVTAGVATDLLPVLKKDDSYSPNKNKNRNRFNVDINATDNDFDGIMHGLILPKFLTKDDITKKKDKVITFNATIISSTDSYHDGINSYFFISCTLE